MRTRGLLAVVVALALAPAALGAQTAPVLPGGIPATTVAEAAMVGDVEAVREFLAAGADVDGALGDGVTALHWAAEAGRADLTRLLLDAGADVAARTRLGAYTPLHLGARSGEPEVVRALLDAGSDPRATTTTGDVQPIHFAAAAGGAEAVELLLAAGADPNATESQWGQTPLMFAAAADRVDAIRALVAGGGDVSATALIVDIPARSEADGADRRARNRRLAGLPPEPDPPSGEATGAGSTSASGYAAEPDPSQPLTAQELAEQVDREGETRGRMSYAELVGTHGGLTPLLLAAREGQEAAAFALLEAGADIDQRGPGDGTTPLLMASINGHFDLALALLEAGADPTLASVADATPLYAVLNTEWAPKSRHPQPTDRLRQEVTYLELMRALLDAGADPNVRINRRLWYTTYSRDNLGVNRTGATPFWRAAYALDVPAMELLVEYGADPDVGTMMLDTGRRGGDDDRTDPSGLPPLEPGENAVMPIHAATGVGYGQGYAGNDHRHAPDAWLPAVRYLVEVHGADVNARDLDGYTPVHHAASRGDNEVILYLVEKGADVTAVSRRGQTTVDIANGPVQRISPFPETIALLEKLGAKNNHRCLSC